MKRVIRLRQGSILDYQDLEFPDSMLDMLAVQNDDNRHPIVTHDWKITIIAERKKQ